jgi:hypothetical protein
MGTGVVNTEQPRLDEADVERVLALTAEICTLNDSIRRLQGAPDARRALVARRNELIAEMRASRLAGDAG